MNHFRLWTLVIAGSLVATAAAQAQDSLQNAGTASAAGSTAIGQSAMVVGALPVGSVAVGSVIVGGSAMADGASLVGGGSALAEKAGEASDFGTRPLTVDKEIVVAAQPAPKVPHDAQPAAAPTN